MSRAPCAAGECLIMNPCCAVPGVSLWVVARLCASCGCGFSVRMVVVWATDALWVLCGPLACSCR